MEIYSVTTPNVISSAKCVNIQISCSDVTGDLYKLFYECTDKSSFNLINKEIVHATSSGS